MIVKSSKALVTYLDEVAGQSGLADHIRTCRFEEGAYLLWQDESPEYVYVIRSGIAKCFITEENGRSYVLEFLGTGEIIGELEILTGLVNVSTVQALTPLLAYRIKATAFQEQLMADAPFTRLLLAELAHRLSRTSRRASYQQLYPLEYGVLKVLFLYADSQQTVTKQDLADYLAVPLRSLNRALRQLEERGLKITVTNGQVVVPKEKLQELMAASYS